MNESSRSEKSDSFHRECFLKNLHALRVATQINRIALAYIKKMRTDLVRRLRLGNGDDCSKIGDQEEQWQVPNFAKFERGKRHTRDNNEISSYDGKLEYRQ